MPLFFGATLAAQKSGRYWETEGSNPSRSAIPNLHRLL